MKIKMPSLKDRAYIHRKLVMSFKAGSTDEGLKFFNQALMRFCAALGLKTPKIEWCKTLGPHLLGLCRDDGFMRLHGNGYVTDTNG